MWLLLKVPSRSQSALAFSPFTLKRLSSSKRWQARQLKDHFTREATVQGLKSRAAFKLIQIDAKYHIFHSGQTVVDLGYAPGSWSQVAVSRTGRNGRVLGVDIIPAQPPKGVSTIQGNFLDPSIQAYVQNFLHDPTRGQQHRPGIIPHVGLGHEASGLDVDTKNPINNCEEIEEPCLLTGKRTVDVVLSDMMMNTSGMSFRDHAGSMDLCRAALQFSFEVLKAGGHFVCKFYQGAEDKDLEKQLKRLFQKVHRLKPESSRNESKEAYFIGLARKQHATRHEVLTSP
ncbi:FtsJ-like methyltransferase-domain-containing protein [Aspergillus pseudotamarii]|uniref:rRNA methyltransferase 2, mitochondrial n=1 Tax=Aspergillus pseudotamarii TaxID=132259 RepID=A0A5N6SCU9_ASPPS|nr:FtsJ-like methyltransferase-domain-containing protein [Aspergillus pseudotamarii]KAE8132542.1 FtsJ-like methyltransferase-domain-containing protein [Aspergillus pseudotamarii]